MFDVIIIGGGPAGISASLYTKRGNKKTLVINSESSTLQEVHKIENYYGFENGISGKELYDIGIKQAKNLGIEVKQEEVLSVKINEKGFEVITNKDTYESEAVIISVGNKKNKVKIKGIKDFEGKGVSYCAICDGFFYRDKEVAVIGSGNYAISETNDLINIAKKVTILTNGEKAPEFRADNVEINSKPIEEIEGKEKVEKVVFNDRTSINADGIFVAQGTAGGFELAKKLGLLIKDNHIIVNENMETNIKGVYACGDCTGGLMQVSKSVYQGTVAGLEVIKFLNKNKDIVKSYMKK